MARILVPCALALVLVLGARGSVARAQGAETTPGETAAPVGGETAPAEGAGDEAAATGSAGDAAAADATTSADARWDLVVLSYGGDAPQDVASEARAAAIETLIAEELRVLPEAEVTARISPARLRGASSIAALRAIGDELGTDGVLTVAVWMNDGAPGSVAISIATGGRSFSATADVETDLAAAAAAAVRSALERESRALLVGGGSTASGEASAASASTAGTGEGARGGPVEGDPWAEGGANEATPPSGGPDPLFGIVGPGLLLAIGGAGIGLGIYGVLDGTCDLHGPSGDCLRGEEPNTALGALFIVGGSIATLGAVIWWITGATTSNEPRIDVVGLDWDVTPRPGGATLSARGRF